MVKALVLLSGGLDSMLAAKVLMEQGIEVTGLSFKSFFFGTAKAKKVAEQLGIKLIEADFTEEHLAMVKNPAHGYGKNMNPCIDCHAMMLKKAGEYLTPALSFVRRRGKTPLSKGGEGKYDFVATGEVLGERPMSQNREALDLVEKISGLTGYLIRPLSAKLLNESIPEKTGKVIRGKLLAISGRSRKPQLELVKKYGIKEFASPGGGCLLTDPVFSEKLMKMLEYWPDCGGNDIELLKHGRIFWLRDDKNKYALLTIGRDEKDNQELEKLAEQGDVMIKFTEDTAGPTSLLRIKNYELSITNETREIKVPNELKISKLKLGEVKSQEEIINLGLILAGYYAIKERGKRVRMEIKLINNQ